MAVSPGNLRASSQSVVQHYIAVARHRKWPMLLAFVLPLAASIFLYTQQDASYQATADVLVRRQSEANALAGVPDPASYSPEESLRKIQTQAAIAKSPDVAARTLRAASVRDTTDAFLSSASVKPDPDADLLRFAVDNGEPAVAIKLVNAYASEFVAYSRRLDTSALDSAETQINRDLRSLDDSSAPLAQSLKEKKQQIDTLQALQTANATVIRRADDASQVEPRLKRQLALGIFGGLALAIAIAALLESLDTRVRSGRDIESMLDLQLLTRAGPPPEGAKSIIMLESPNVPEAEAFRLLRLTARQAIAGGARSIMISSSVKGEGKSTTIANLAVALARGGERVILVDLDLRRPTLRRLFDQPPRQGVGDIMHGKVEPLAALHEIPIPLSGGVSADLQHPGEQQGSLRLLQAGTALESPGEALISPALGQLVRELTEHCDIVLLDSPPLLQVGDATTLSEVADAMFLCIRVPEITRPMLSELQHALGRVDAKVLGFVLTGRVRSEDDNYGVRYGYAARADEPVPASPSGVASEQPLVEAGRGERAN